MAHVNFHVELSTFVNWYFGITNADEITPDLLTACGFDDNKTFCEFLSDNYKNNVHVEMIPDKFNEFAKITMTNGKTFTLQCDGIDELLNNTATDSRVICNYRDFDVKMCKVFDRILYAVAIYNTNPDFNVFFATFDDIRKYIDNNPNGL